MAKLTATQKAVLKAMQERKYTIKKYNYMDTLQDEHNYSVNWVITKKTTQALVDAGLIIEKKGVYYLKEKP